jgi:hypothetical protein
MAALTFTNWVNTLCGLWNFTTSTTATDNVTLVAPGLYVDTNFATQIPLAIDYTENRIQRDLNLIGCSVTDESGSMTANTRHTLLPSDIGTYIDVTEVYPIVSGVQQSPLLKVSRPYLDFVWPSNTAPSSPSIPALWCFSDQLSILVAPPPDQNYGLGIVGTQRVAQLSSSTQTNLLSTLFPELYVACSNIFIAGYQRDFGAQSEDPKMAMSWETQYNILLKGSQVEDARKHFTGGNAPAPNAEK